MHERGFEKPTPLWHEIPAYVIAENNLYPLKTVWSYDLADPFAVKMECFTEGNPNFYSLWTFGRSLIREPFKAPEDQSMSVHSDIAFLPHRYDVEVEGNVYVTMRISANEIDGYYLVQKTLLQEFLDESEQTASDEVASELQQAIVEGCIPQLLDTKD